MIARGMRAPLSVLASGLVVVALGGCGGGAGEGEDSRSYQQGYDIGTSLPRGGQQGRMLCRETVSFASLNPADGEDLEAALKGCYDAVDGRG
jgi:hypothetical protein